MDKKIFTKNVIFIFVIINCTFNDVLTSSVSGNRKQTEEGNFNLTNSRYNVENAGDAHIEEVVKLNCPDESFFNTEPRGDVSKLSWRYRSRTKREPKLGQKSSFFILSRRSRDRNKLEVRRKNVKDMRYKMSHSIGVKSVLDDKKNGRMKRSADSTDVLLDSLPAGNASRSDSFVKDEMESPLLQDSLTSTYNSSNAHNSLEIMQNLTEGHEESPLAEDQPLHEGRLSVGPGVQQIQNDTFKQDLKLLKENEEGKVEAPVSNDTHISIEMLEVGQVNATSESDSVMGNHTLQTVTPPSESILHSNTTEITLDLPITEMTGKPPSTLSEEQFSSNQTISPGTLDKRVVNISLLPFDKIYPTSTQNEREVTKELETVQMELKNGSVNATIEETLEKAVIVTSNNETTTPQAELPAPRSRTKVKLKQVKPHPNMVKWIKGSTLQLPILTVPLRKCPQGQRIRQGKCVQVY